MAELIELWKMMKLGKVDQKEYLRKAVLETWNLALIPGKNQTVHDIMIVSAPNSDVGTKLGLWRTQVAILCLVAF